MLLTLSITLFLQVAPPGNLLTADLDGDGVAETATAKARGKKVRLEIRDSRDKLLAKSPVPAPTSGNVDLALSSGSLGSTGAILEVVAADPRSECHSLWRYRDGKLYRLALTTRAGQVADCHARQEWSSRWERGSEDAPAVYIRERSRPTSDGLHHETDVFRYEGFRLEMDPQRSTAEIGGVAIPIWHDAVLYPKPALDGLSNAFDLSALKKGPRLHILTDRLQGVFALRFEDPSGVERFPVTSATEGEAEGQLKLTLKSASGAGQARVQLAGNGAIPIEITADGLGERLDGAYTPVKQLTESAIKIFQSAEDELAELHLAGVWDTEKPERVSVTLSATPPAVLRFGKSEVSLDISRAPEGVDVLLIPRDGSAPTLGIALRGANAILRVPVVCSGRDLICQTKGPGELLHRVGARVNLR